jgi:drug/metabolite transporter (DMT)-like permease
VSSNRQGQAVLALVGAAFLFGATFVVVKSALDSMEPIAFVGWRFAIGALVLLALAVPRGRAIWSHGAIAGVALFGGYALQTAGLETTSASSSALITGLYVVLTPFVAAVFSRRRPSGWVVTGAVIAFSGVALLTGLDGFDLGAGNLLTLGCAFAFAIHIVVLAHYAHRHPVIPFTMVQTAITAALAFAASLLVEGAPSLPPREVWAALALTGIGVTAGAFVLQVWAQRVVGASTAAVVLAAEPAFGVAAGWVVLGERLDAAGWLGAGLIVAAIFLVITRQRDQASRQAEAVSLAH